MSGCLGYAALMPGISTPDSSIDVGCGRPGYVLLLNHAFTGADLYQVRSVVAAHASACGLRGHPLERLVLIAGELAANAAIHGGGGGVLRLCHGPMAILVSVCDSGPGLADPDLAGTVQPRLGQRRGRGLYAVRALAGEVEIHSGSAGTRVVAVVNTTEP
jgi:anti-sigma regulatory factor (Ser/Thr protein kinase)